MIHSRSRLALDRRRRRRPTLRSLRRRPQASKLGPPASLKDYLAELSDGNLCGDNFKRRLDGTTRLTFQNVDGIEEFSDGSKQEQLKNW